MAHYLIECSKVKVSSFLPFLNFKRFLMSVNPNPLIFNLVCLSQLSRNQRFSASFQHAVETLVNMLMPHITQKYKDNLDAARNANHSLAVFIKVGAHFYVAMVDWALICS